MLILKTGDDNKAIIASTASPYKFTNSVMKAIDSSYEAYSDFELIEKMNALTKVDIPVGIKDIDKRPIRHKTVCKKMK